MNPFEASPALSLLGDRRPLFSTKRPFVKLLYVACTCYRIKSVGWEFLALVFARSIARSSRLCVSYLWCSYHRPAHPQQEPEETERWAGAVRSANADLDANVCKALCVNAHLSRAKNARRRWGTRIVVCSSASNPSSINRLRGSTSSVNEIAIVTCDQVYSRRV